MNDDMICGWVWFDGCFHAYRYTLLVGKPPFETSTLKETYMRIKRNEYRIPTHVSPEARNLISRLLLPEPTQRPPASEVLDDPFFSSGYLPARLPVRWVCLGVWLHHAPFA